MYTVFDSIYRTSLLNISITTPWYKYISYEHFAMLLIIVPKLWKSPNFENIQATKEGKIMYITIFAYILWRLFKHAMHATHIIIVNTMLLFFCQICNNLVSFVAYNTPIGKANAVIYQLQSNHAFTVYTT